LSDDAVIHLISTSCVPVAFDIKKFTDAFFESVKAQSTQPMGVWLATPDGKVLASNASGGDAPNGARVMLADLRAGLKKFGTVAPRRVGPMNSLPYRGVGVRPDGSVTLAITDKILNGKPGTRPVESLGVERMYLDSATLSASQWSSLAPPDARAGARWTIPAETGRQFYPVLSHVRSFFKDPGEVTDVPLVGRVASVRGDIAYLVYDGRIAGTQYGTTANGVYRHGDTSELKMIGGVGAYDIRAMQMVSLTWVWDGSFEWMRFGAVVEWRRGDAKALAPIEADSPRPETRVELADSAPEDALRTFLVALAAHDEATLRAVTLPHAEFDLLLKGPSAQPEQVVLLKARLEETPMKRLRVGDPVKMPDGESRVIKPTDVGEGRVVLWPAGAPLPSRLEEVGGHWKVFAAPFIAARK